MKETAYNFVFLAYLMLNAYRKAQIQAIHPCSQMLTKISLLQKKQLIQFRNQNK